MTYRGSAYYGWQIQPDNDTLPSVQQTLVDLLDPLIASATTANKNKHQQYKDKDKNKDAQNEPTSPTKKTQNKIKPPKSIDIRVCSRTDSGVNALLQVCRVRTYNDVDANDIKRTINNGIKKRSGITEQMISSSSPSSLPTTKMATILPTVAQLNTTTTLL